MKFYAVTSRQFWDHLDSISWYRVLFARKYETYDDHI